MDEMDRRNLGEDPTVMGNDVPREPNVDDREVTAKPVRDDNPTTADYVGETAGGISGGLAGAAIGSIAGPVGTLIGGLAGVVGGWWAGRSIAEAAKDYGDVDDRYYRTHYESSGRARDRSFDDIRPAYQIGTWRAVTRITAVAISTRSNRICVAVGRTTSARVTASGPRCATMRVKATHADRRRWLRRPPAPSTAPFARASVSTT